MTKPRNKNKTAPFSIDPALFTQIPAHKEGAEVINLDFFVVDSADAQSSVRSLIKQIVRHVNQHKLSYSQLRYVFRAVRTKCDIAVESGRGRKLYELPTTDELKAFYGVIENPVHTLIFETLESSGLRVSELCNLEVKRIDFKTNILFVANAKGGKDRSTVIGPRILDKIKLYLEGRNNRYLFESNRGSKFSSRRIQQLCQEYRMLAKIEKKLSIHTFRHIFFSRLADAGVPAEKRMILAGHSSEAVQAIYTHLGVGGIRDEALEILRKAGF